MLAYYLQVLFSIPATLADCYNYGKIEISTMAKHFDVDYAETLSEWKEVVIAIRSEMSEGKKLKIKDVLFYIVEKQHIYPCLSKIACALLIVPVHIADCERGFSALGRIKTKNRSHLTNQSLNS